MTPPNGKCTILEKTGEWDKNEVQGEHKEIIHLETTKDNEKTADDDMVVYKSSTSLSGLCKSDGYLKCGTLVKREGCVRDVPKSEHAIFLHPDTTEYKEKASELEEVMSVKNISLSVLCQFANSSIPNISQ